MKVENVIIRVCYVWAGQGLQESLHNHALSGWLKQEYEEVHFVVRLYKVGSGLMIEDSLEGVPVNVSAALIMQTVSSS